MKIISFEELKFMDENEIISVSKNAIHIQIVKYESLQHNEYEILKKLDLLTQTLSKLLEIERESNRHIQCVHMKVAEIRECFTKDDFPRSTFVQYKQL